MTRNNTLAAIGTALAMTSTAALAQQAGPDFSPMRPDTYTEVPTVPAGAPPVRTDNRMPDAHESSNAVRTEPAAPPVYTETYTDGTPVRDHRVAVEPGMPRQSTIGNGLFDRRGPNDFGA